VGTFRCAWTNISNYSAFRVYKLKVIIAYDEEDGDFVFTRGSKRTKTAPSEPEPAPAPVPPPKKSRKPKERERDEEPTLTVKKTRGRKMSFSTPKTEKDAVVPKRKKSTRASTGQNGETSTHQPGTETTDYDSIDIIGAPPPEETSKSMVEVISQSTMIALPFSDTPVINRNKELRKKGGSGRRSSLGMRGRRASSLIDNGHSAIPHREVETKHFYKHIEADGLSEPRRMKQLLTWNGERALGEKPSHGDPDSAAALAGKHDVQLFGKPGLTLLARMIKESLLKDFANKSEFSDWFNREDSATAPVKIVKKPNPRNIEIEENLVGLEERIKRYENVDPMSRLC
jgi:kinetochore protein Mis13/DSN1